MTARAARTQTALAGVDVIAFTRLRDMRGELVELGGAAHWPALGLPPLVHDVLSVSARHVLRGLHLQDPSPQGKLVSVISGRIFDVAVDLRPGPTLGRWVGLELARPAVDVDDRWMALWIPEGFAHGFLVLSDEATVLYRCSATYAPGAQHAIRWDDPTLGITWPLTAEPILSDKDRSAPDLTTWLAGRTPVQ